MVQPRAALRFAVIASVCVPPVAPRRAVRVNEQFLDRERGHEQERASADFPGKTHLGVEKELLVRECVAGRAKDWPELHARLGLTMPNDGNVTDPPLDLVIKVFKLKDKIEASLASHKFNWFFKTEETMAWEKEEENTAKQLLSYRFDYDTAFDRCAKGSTDLSYECMTASACPNHTSDCKSLQDSVKQRIDARDLVEHLRDMRSWYHDYSKDESYLWEEVKKIDKSLKGGKYSWTKTKSFCRKHLEEDVEAIKQRVLGELSAGEEQEDGACHEKADMMCPEGTYTTTQRRWNHAAGAGVFGTAFFVAKFTLLPLGGAIGTALAGPVGGTVGLLAANALVTPVALASGYWASRGPMECACFPRECTYSNETKTCAMHAPDEERATKNPWGDKLPMAGTKCALRSRATWHGKPPSQDECDLQQCTHEDYTHAISGQTNLWGTAGLKGKGIYNCLSTSQFPADILAIAPAFPDGRPNTIAERNRVFTEVIARGGLDSEAVAVTMNWDIVNYTGCEDCHEAEFCVYAGNPGCGGIGTADAVTFDNRHNVKGCPIRPILTIPGSYIRDIADLQAKGAGLAKDMLNIMLQQGFREYRDRGHSGPVRQCIHMPSSVSVHWLHLHSFCVGPSFDGMPGNYSLCELMEDVGDADQIAGDWSTAPLAGRSDAM